MSTKGNKQDKDSLIILQKVMENSYQRKVLKEVVDRVYAKMTSLLDEKFPTTDFKKLKEEFMNLKHSINIS